MLGPRMASLPERLGDRYSLVEPIGQGGMGQVYRARDELLARDVAVKLIVDDGSSGDDFARRCVREARAAASVEHPGIVQVYDGGVQDGVGYLVMELVRGRTLRDLLRERGPLPPDEALAIAAHLADALAAAHAHGVVHCDVKPGNVIMLGDAPKLVDFGIAQATATTRPLGTGEAQGSVHYVAPEQLDGRAIDARTDVYALGAVTYEMLTGRPPFEGTNATAVAAQRLVADPRPPSELNPAILPALDRVVLRALARDPDHRYASAGELRDALRSPVTDPIDATVRLETLPRDRDDASVTEVVPPVARPAAPPTATIPPPNTGWVQQPPRVRSSRAWLAPLAAALVALLFVAFIVMALGAATGGDGSAGTATVPNLVERRLSEVPPTLRDARLTAGEVTTRAVEAPRVGTILEQDPAAGASASVGDAVDIVVGVAR